MEVIDAKGRAFAHSVSGCSCFLLNLQPETTAAVAADFIMCTAAAVRVSIAHAIIGKIRQFVFVFSTVKLYTKNPHLFVALFCVSVDSAV